MSRTNRFTAEQRRQSVDIYTRLGRAKAAEITGVSGRTISTWVQRAESVGQASQDIDASQGAFALRRERMRLAILDEAEAVLNAMHGEPDPSARRDLAVAFGALFDRLHALISQEPT